MAEEMSSILVINSTSCTFVASLPCNVVRSGVSMSYGPKLCALLETDPACHMLFVREEALKFLAMSVELKNIRP
jgi:hypothetical protein